jgi:hypothetical protein
MFSNYYNQNIAQTFNWAAVNVGVIGLRVAGYNSNVIFTNVGEWRFMAGDVILTNTSGNVGTNAGTIFIHNTANSQLGASTTWSGNMAFYLGDLSGHTSSSRTVTQNLPSLCISNLGVTMANSSQAFTLGTMTANLTFNGSGTSTVIGSLYVSRLTSVTNGYTNNSALTIGGTGTFNIASTNSNNVRTSPFSAGNGATAVFGWNSGLIVTNSASVYVAGQTSLGAQAWNLKIGTTNQGVTTFGVFTNNEWATNSATYVTLTNNFLIANSGAAKNIFKAQTDRTLVLSGTVWGANTNGTLVADAGTLVLSGNNTQLNLPFIVTNSGTLVASNNNALGSSSVTVASGSTLRINAAIANRVINNGGVRIADGGSLVSSNFYSVSGSLTVGATVPNTASFNGSLGSWTNTVGALSLTGNGTLELSVTRGINSTGLVAISSTGNLITVTGTANVGTNNLVVGTSLTGASASSIALNGSAVGSPSAPIPLGGSYTASNGIKYTFTNSPTALQLVVSNPDTDGDGVTDVMELKDGTNPNDASSYNNLSKGLVAYYPFNGNANDESGNGNHAALSSQGQLTANRFGTQNSALFCNTGGALGSQIAESTQNIPITGNSDRTIAFWCKFSTEGTSGQYTQTGVEWGTTGQAGGMSHLSQQSSGYIWLWGHYADVGAIPVQASSYNQWRQIVLSYSGSLSNGKIYIDGSSVPISDIGRLNQRDTFATVATTLRLKGGQGDFLDDIRIYNRALSATEVGQLYQTEAASLDSDSDGLTDAWERGYGRYQIVSGSFTWEQAKADAESRGGHLATITNVGESGFIQNMVDGLQVKDNYWLGGTDAGSEGNWRWLTGETWSFSHWDPTGGEPNNSSGGENYLNLWGSPGNMWQMKYGYWNDYINDDAVKMSYILEFGYPTDPTKADTDGDGFDDVHLQQPCRFHLRRADARRQVLGLDRPRLRPGDRLDCHGPPSGVAQFFVIRLKGPRRSL